MSDGRLHKKLAFVGLWVVVVPTSIVILLFTGNALYAFLFFLGGLFSIYITPDRDHLAMTHEKYHDIKVFGILGSLWLSWWYPYAMIFPHRSKLSHSIIGSVIRFIYFIIVIIINVLLVYFILGMFFPDVLKTLSIIESIKDNPDNTKTILIMCTSWMYIDLYHYWRDGIYRNIVVNILTIPRLLVNNESQQSSYKMPRSDSELQWSNDWYRPRNKNNRSRHSKR